MLDRTNFQPELTLRNAIRHVLASNEKEKRRSAELVVRLCSLHGRIKMLSDMGYGTSL